jgi:hypothetical protein
VAYNCLMRCPSETTLGCVPEHSVSSEYRKPGVNDGFESAPTHVIRWLFSERNIPYGLNSSSTKYWKVAHPIEMSGTRGLLDEKGDICCRRVFFIEKSLRNKITGDRTGAVTNRLQQTRYEFRNVCLGETNDACSPRKNQEPPRSKPKEYPLGKSKLGHCKDESVVIVRSQAFFLGGTGAAEKLLLGKATVVAGLSFLN